MSYCPAPPPPLPPAPPCSEFAEATGFLCLGATAGSAPLLLETENVSCAGDKPLGCAQSLAAKCDALSRCVAFSVAGSKASFFMADPQPPIPSSPTKTLLAMPCNPNDPNQHVVFTPSDAEALSGQLVAPGGLCVDVGCDPVNHTHRFVAPIPLTPCKPGSLGQAWKQVPHAGTSTNEPFLVSMCPHDPKDPHKWGSRNNPGDAVTCLDISCGGMKTATETVTWACGVNDTQFGTWLLYGNTFKEERNGKCLSIGRSAAGGHAFEVSASSVAWMKSKPSALHPPSWHVKTDDVGIHSVASAPVLVAKQSANESTLWFPLLQHAMGGDPGRIMMRAQTSADLDNGTTDAVFFSSTYGRSWKRVEVGPHEPV